MSLMLSLFFRCFSSTLLFFHSFSFVFSFYAPVYSISVVISTPVANFCANASFQHLLFAEHIVSDFFYILYNGL